MGNELVILNKYATIEKCINRIKSVYDGKMETLEIYDNQDIIVLNLQRACQAAIDIAMYIISVNNLGVPQTGKGAFKLLNENNIIDEEITKKMQGMIGFRNIAVHDYQEVDIDILKNILDEHLNDLIDFSKLMLKK